MVKLLTVFALAAALLIAQAPGRKKRTVTDEEVMRVHKAAILIDTHNDAPMRVMHGWNIASTGTGGSTDLQRLRAGNVAAVSNHVDEARAWEMPQHKIDTPDVFGRFVSPDGLARAGEASGLEPVYEFPLRVAASLPILDLGSSKSHARAEFCGARDALEKHGALGSAGNCRVSIEHATEQRCAAAAAAANHDGRCWGYVVGSKALQQSPPITVAQKIKQE